MIPSIIAPVYFGIRRLVLQEKAATEKPRNGDMLSIDSSLFARQSYKEYFCEREFDHEVNPFSDASEENFEGNKINSPFR